MPGPNGSHSFSEYSPLDRVEFDPRFAEEAAQVARSLIGYRVSNELPDMFALVEECVRRVYSGDRIRTLENNSTPEAPAVFEARYGAKWLTSLLICMSTIAANAVHAKVQPFDEDEDNFTAGVRLYQELCAALQINGITH